MSSIITAVFKATIGLLVNKGRDKAAEKLKDGDVSDQKFRGLIVRELDDIKSKLDGLSRKDLLASISFFEEGIELLYVVFDKARSGREENGKETTQVEAACAEAFSLAEEMRDLSITGLDESASRALANAKKRFEDARREATRAFKNEALSTSDRILAMQYRVMATILETVDNPIDAVPPCRVCVKELNSLLAVQNSFDVQLKKGIQAVKGLFSKDERRKVICCVCQVNRVVFDVAQVVDKVEPLLMSPAVDTEEGKIDPLRDVRLTGDLYKLGMEHCIVKPWSLGQEGEEKHKLERPVAITTNSRGHFIVADYYYDIRLMVFDSRGAFINNLVMIRMPDGVNQVQRIFDIASDMKDSVYVSVKLYNIKTGKLKFALYKFNFTSDYIYQFPLKETCHYDWLAMTVMDSGQVFVAGKSLEGNDEIDVYGTDGQLVRSFGKGLFTSVLDITAVNDGRVMAVDGYDNNVHIFSEHGDHLNKFKLEGYFPHPRIEFHESSDHLIVACVESSKNRLHVRIYTKDGVFVQSTQIHVESAIGSFLKGIAVTADGHIATVVKARDNRSMVLVV